MNLQPALSLKLWWEFNWDTLGCKSQKLNFNQFNKKANFWEGFWYNEENEGDGMCVKVAPTWLE